MSVRMALAKLTACAAGGAVIGGGAVHMVESPKRPAVLKQTKPSRKIVHRRVAAVPVRRVVTRRTVTTTPPPTVITVTTQDPPVPVPLPAAAPAFVSGGGYVPAVIGGWGGGWGGGFGGGRSSSGRW